MCQLGAPGPKLAFLVLMEVFKVTLSRCGWAQQDEQLMQYHDTEWGVNPGTDSQWLEMVVLETFQAGLSWRTVLHKREAIRQALVSFDVARLADKSSADVDIWMQNKLLIRNRKKLESAIKNAKVVQDIVAQHFSMNHILLPMKDQPDILLPYLCKTFHFVGRTTAESIAYATGLLPAPHESTCFLHVAEGRPELPFVDSPV